MTGWEPATEVEAAMRNALRADDQELYFRILSRAELLLPVSAEALAGQAPMGWGTWTTAGRTHVLAFTSLAALRACLAENAGATRRSPYAELAAGWPNPEWWLAVNPGLPIEGYLPAWFVAQLARGDVRLPGRNLGARARLEQVERAARARATAAVPRRPVPPPRPEPAPPPRSEPAPPPYAQVAPPYPAAPIDPGPAPVQPWSPTEPFHRVEPVQRPEVPPAGEAYPAAAQTTVSMFAPARGADAPTDGLDGPATAEPTIGWMTPASERRAGAARRMSPPPSEEPSLFTPAAQRSTDEWLADRSDAGPTSEEPGPSEAPSGAEPTGGPEPTGGLSEGHDGAGAADAGPVVPADFVPANDVERTLLDAAGSGSTDQFLSTLLLATVLLPVAADSIVGSRPGEPGFQWRTESLDGETYVVVFTSSERLAEHLPVTVETIPVKFARLIRRWPDESWSFAVNPGTPVGAKLPGREVVALANWAAEAGLGEDTEPGESASPAASAEQAAPRSTYQPARQDPGRPTMMQKTIPPGQLSYYLERGYDRVSGFVHRASEVAHLRTPAQLFAALGLNYPGSPFSPDADEVHVLRWPAHRPSLYRIPYGGQNEAAMRAMEGWVIERPPFRGNGFAPGDSSDVVAEFKVDSVRLPHGAQLWRIRADGTEEIVATLDCDGPTWRRKGDE